MAGSPRRTVRSVSGTSDDSHFWSHKWILAIFFASVGLALFVMLVAGSAVTAAISAFFVMTAGIGQIVAQTALRGVNQGAPISMLQMLTRQLSAREPESKSTWWVQKGAPQIAGPDPFRTFCVTKSYQSGLLAEVADQAVSIGRCADLTNSLATAISAIADQPSRWDTLFVDLDDCEEHAALSALVDELCAFRTAVPEVKVLICSLLFGRDDWGTDRLTLADVSIRKPCSASRVIQCIPIADENNRTWRTRHGNFSAPVSRRSL